MRLADFILANIEPILAGWEVFARSAVAGADMDKLALRDHAEDILRATARDMVSAQSVTQQSDKSIGQGDGGKESLRLDGASGVHGVGRVSSGFDLIELVAEYRALRASVIRLWRDSRPNPDLRDLDDLTRFNESIDQSLAEAVRSYSEQINRSRQMFLAILGHDLRNPLNAIIMSAEALPLTGDLNVEAVEMVSGISASGAAMAKMISDLLDFTSTGLGSAIPVSLADMDLKNLCRAVVDEMQAAHPTRTFEVRASGDLTGVWDAARLRQMVSNLLGNAVQHGTPDSPVVVTVGADGSDLVLTVQNRGVPISPAAIPTIFEPLVRDMSSDKQRQRQPGSIGLGLYIARQVASAHGGTIDATSSQEDGTVFTVRLPRRAADRSAQ
jgi:signal transduction histidine kinase